MLTVSSNTLLQISAFGHRWVLAAGTEEIAEGLKGHATGASLVEEGECFFVVGGSLV